MSIEVPKRKYYEEPVMFTWYHFKELYWFEENYVVCLAYYFWEIYRYCYKKSSHDTIISIRTDKTKLQAFIDIFQSFTCLKQKIIAENSRKCYKQNLLLLVITFAYSKC